MGNKRFWVLIGIGSIVVLFLIVLSNVLAVGERLRNIHEYVEYAFYGLSVILFYVLIINPIRVIAFSPTFTVDAMLSDDVKRHKIYRDAAHVLLKNEHITDEDKELLIAFMLEGLTVEEQTDEEYQLFLTEAGKNLTKFKTAVTADLPGVLYKTEIQEGNLGSFLDYDAPIDSQILTQATNALGVDAMNAKLFGTGPEAKKLQYNPKTQQYSIPESKRRSQFSQNLRGSFPLNPTERILAPQTVAEAKLYRDAGITHGQHKTGNKYKNVGDRVIPIYNKIFFDDDVTPVPVGRYNQGGQVGMGLGSL